MNSNIDFSECLNELMRAADLKNSKLAKAINVDASLIYKWLNNKSIPPYNSRHIDLIAHQVLKNTNNSYQSKNLNEFLKKNITGCFEINENNKFDLLKNILSESQGYSIEKRKKLKKNSMNTSVLNKSFTNVSTNSIHSCCNYKDTLSNVQIITGHEAVFSAILNLLETASTSTLSNETIMITYLTEMSKISQYPAVTNKWKELLLKLTQKGCKVISLIHVNNDNTRNTKIVDDMLSPISTGNYQIYYTSGNNYPLPFELILIPNVGSLFCISSCNKDQIDSAFLLKDKEALNIFSGYYYQILATTKPLLKSCLPVESIGFQRDFSEIEEIPGNRFSMLSELGTLTIPLSLYEQNLKKSNISSDDLLKKMMYHKIKIDAFQSQVKHYKFREIIYDECISNLINNKQYSYLDKYYLCNDMIVKNDDIIKHLSNAIRLLKKYQNYEIGLANNKLICSILSTNWIVKENSAVSLISYSSKNLDSQEGEEVPNTLHGYTITQPNIVKAYECYFDNIWQQIQPNKKDIICKLENYITLLS